MAQHKWHKEIKAWADGAEIEWRWLPSLNETTDYWRLYQQDNNLTFFQEGVEFRIKPQPKEPQYLYVFMTENGIELGEAGQLVRVKTFNKKYKYMGKIKLEDEQ